MALATSRRALGVFLVLLAFTGPAAAGSSADTKPSERRVCVTERTTGSHLGRRVCMTESEREERRLADKAAMERLRPVRTPSAGSGTKP